MASISQPPTLSSVDHRSDVHAALNRREAGGRSPRRSACPATGTSKYCRLPHVTRSGQPSRFRHGEIIAGEHHESHSLISPPSTRYLTASAYSSAKRRCLRRRRRSFQFMTVRRISLDEPARSRCERHFMPGASAALKIMMVPADEAAVPSLLPRSGDCQASIRAARPSARLFIVTARG